MKVTKVNRARLAVQREDSGKGRGIFYENPKTQTEESADLTEKIQSRIQEANKLYNVFFTAGSTSGLEEFFKRLVNYVRKTGKYRSEGISDIMAKFTQYKKGNGDIVKITDFSYNVSGTKSLRKEMMLHVQERMSDFWQDPEIKNAAAAVLACICDGRNYQEKVQNLPDELLNLFWKACRECPAEDRFPQVYVERFVKINGFSGQAGKRYTLDDLFGAVIKYFVMRKVAENDVIIFLENDTENDKVREKKEKALSRLADQLAGLTYVRMRNAEIRLQDICYPYATEERLQAVLVRMRKTLKREDGMKAAIRLMQGLAQMETADPDGNHTRRSWKSEINSMMKSPDGRKELGHFIKAIIIDYYKPNIMRSLRHVNVKVQPGLKAETGGQCLDLSSAALGKKKGLSRTLERYAASKQESDQVLIDIKSILFDYFLSAEKRKEFLCETKLWDFPEYDSDIRDMWFDDGHPKKNPEDRLLKEICSVYMKDDRLAPKAAAEAKRRIRYVNYGRYINLLSGLDVSDENKEFEAYWVKYIKEFVDRYYLGNRTLWRNSCLCINMMKACWDDVIHFLCGKYIDLGKAVYHFAMPEDLSPGHDASYGIIREEYCHGISSFDYEIIKADETLERDISVSMMASTAAFSASVVDEEHRQDQEVSNNLSWEDVLLLNQPDLQKITKQNAAAQILRFYGGKSAVQNLPEGFWSNPQKQNVFLYEIKEQLYAVRNKYYHYMDGKEKTLPQEYARLLWTNDEKANCDVIRQKYYSNNTGMFYKFGDIQNLVKKLYVGNGMQDKAYVKRQYADTSAVPAFRKAWKRKDIPAYIDQLIMVGEKRPEFLNSKQDYELRNIYGGTLYFLLQEIYYRDFVLNPKAAEYFFRAVEDYKKEEERKGKNSKDYWAVESFASYVRRLKNAGLTFGGICQTILQEFNQQNTGHEKEESYKHFQICLPVCVQKAFRKFIEDERNGYGFLFCPDSHMLTGEQNYLDDLPLRYMEFPENNQELICWYTFAHFLHPRKLNFLIGDLKHYIQYRNDILRRSKNAGLFKGQMGILKKAEQDAGIARKWTEDILNVLEFVRGVSGRISGEFTDYYGGADGEDGREAYARYLSYYVDFWKKDHVSVFEDLKDFCQNTLPHGTIDIYSDAQNPKLLRNIELARMYAGGDIRLAGRERVTAGKVIEYYENREKVGKILSEGVCKSEKDQKLLVRQQQLKNRLMFNDVTDIYELLNEMLGQLISLAYLRERDEMYLFLGFYYMALRSGNGWEGEYLHGTVSLNSQDAGKVPGAAEAARGSDYAVKNGLVLYQVVSVYDFALGFLYPDTKNGCWKTRKGTSLSTKYMQFYKVHQSSMLCVRRLFGEDERLDQAVDLRNYVDHTKYYTNHEKSIIQLYNEFYEKFFSYSKKLKYTVAHNFEELLERHFIKCDITYFREKKGEGTEPERNRNSYVLRFKPDNLRSEKFTYKLQNGKIVKLDARDSLFIKELRSVLEYGLSEKEPV